MDMNVSPTTARMEGSAVDHRTHRGLESASSDSSFPDVEDGVDATRVSSPRVGVDPASRDAGRRQMETPPARDTPSNAVARMSAPAASFDPPSAGRASMDQISPSGCDNTAVHLAPSRSRSWVTMWTSLPPRSRWVPTANIVASPPPTATMDRAGASQS